MKAQGSTSSAAIAPRIAALDSSISPPSGIAGLTADQPVMLRCFTASHAQTGTMGRYITRMGHHSWCRNRAHLASSFCRPRRVVTYTSSRKTKNSSNAASSSPIQPRPTNDVSGPATRLPNTATSTTIAGV